MHLYWYSLDLICCLCLNLYTWTNFPNLSPLLLQSSVHHQEFQNGGLCRKVNNWKHLFLTSVTTLSQTLSYQISKVFSHLLKAFLYNLMNYRISLNECKAREEIGRQSFLFQSYQILYTWNITYQIIQLFKNLCSF